MVSKRLKVKGLKSYRRKKGRTQEETEEQETWEGRDRCADIYARKGRSTSGSGVGSGGVDDGKGN